MSDEWAIDLFPLAECTERVEAVPVADLLAYLVTLDPTAERWGFAATAVRARLGRLSLREWSEILAAPRLLEARLWDTTEDLHWLEGRGVLLRVIPTSASVTGGASLAVDGSGWLVRRRRSRLWGEWLEEAGGWYEERIPDVLHYDGIAPGAESRNVFLVAREYVRLGVVEHVRYLSVEGAKE